MLLHSRLDVAFLFVAALTLVGCGGSHAQTATGSRFVHMALYARGTGPHITYPSDWHFRRETGPAGSFTLWLATLSTGTPPCDGCSLVLTPLSPHEATMRWSAYGFPTWRLQSTPGKRVVIHGRSARLDIHPGIDLPGMGILETCPSGTTETIRATIGRNSENFYQMLACIRGPGQAGLQRQVLAILRSIRDAGA
jgi:hypothetical protein